MFFDLVSGPHREDEDRGVLPNLEEGQMLRLGIEIGRGIVLLCKTKEQYRILKKRSAATNRKGDASRETSPHESDLLKIWFDFQITALSFRDCLGRASCLAFPSRLRHPIRRKSFLAAFVSFVADSLEGFGCAFFYWKIALPMK
jgi:hypothetical protein